MENMGRLLELRTEKGVSKTSEKALGRQANWYLYCDVMNSLDRIFRLTGSVLIGLILVADPYLQAIQLAESCMAVETSCGCACSTPESVPVFPYGHNLAQGSCGCTVASTEPIAEIPLDVQPRSVFNSDVTGENVAVVLPLVEPDLQFADHPGTAIAPGHGPPLYLLHSTYLI